MGQRVREEKKALVPAYGEVSVDIKLVEDAHDDVIDHLLERLRAVVEGRHRWQYRHAHPCELQHVLQMDFMQRRLAHDEHELAPLLQDVIRRAMDEVIAPSGGDGGEGGDAARRDDHAARQERAAGDRRALIVGRVRSVRHLLHLFQRIGRLLREGMGAPFTDDEVRLQFAFGKRLQKADAEDGAGGAGDADDKSGRSGADAVDSSKSQR